MSLIFIILSSKKFIKSLLLNVMDTQVSTLFLVSQATVLKRCLGLFLFSSIKVEKYEERGVERAIF